MPSRTSCFVPPSGRACRDAGCQPAAQDAPSQYIKALQVPSGFDVADDKIVELTQSGDLVITADIPAGRGRYRKGRSRARSPRREYTQENIKERLAMRKLMDELRNSGVDTGGPPSFSNADGRLLPISSIAFSPAKP